MGAHVTRLAGPHHWKPLALGALCLLLLLLRCHWLLVLVLPLLRPYLLLCLACLRLHPAVGSHLGLAGSWASVPLLRAWWPDALALRPTRSP